MADETNGPALRSPCAWVDQRDRAASRAGTPAWCGRLRTQADSTTVRKSVNELSQLGTTGRYGQGILSIRKTYLNSDSLAVADMRFGRACGQTNPPAGCSMAQRSPTRLRTGAVIHGSQEGRRNVRGSVIGARCFRHACAKNRRA